MDAWRSKLLRYSSGYNPLEWIQIPFLTKTLEIAMEAKKEEEEVYRSSSERRRSRKNCPGECKNSMLSKEDREYANYPINREKLDKWFLKGLSIRKSIGGEIIDDFDELSESECYYLINDGKSNFDGYSRVEGDVLTQDCVISILKGVIPIDNFHSSNSTKVIFEYNMAPPKSVQVEMQQLRFPIRPDALLISGDTWLFLESKHKVTKRDIYSFEQKMRFVIKCMDQYWVMQDQTPPKKILYAMCSIGQFDAEAAEAGEAGKSVIKICREGAGYRLL
mmetsp:Transcript_32510/g.46874  ORF Transcript_32510/g.46874 Transcript_32510/m.46874 type:complete len:277 (-) Transcript_32510:135-965(-)